MSAQNEWKEWLRLAINSLGDADTYLGDARMHVSTTYNAMPGNADGESEAFTLRDDIDRIRELLGAATLKAHQVITLIDGDPQSHDDEDEEDDLS